MLASANQLVQRHNLAGMARRMLGSMKDEPERGRRKALPAHLAREKEAGLGYRTQIGNPRVDPSREASKQPWQLGPILVGSALGSEGVELRWRQRGASRVGQEPVQAAGKMEEMEANRRRTTLSRPELLGCQIGDNGKDVLAHLQDGVGRGLEQRDNPVDRSAQPDFGRCSHVRN